MQYKVIFSTLAEKDLFDIGDYIERISFSKEIANRFIAEILSSTHILSLYPCLYPKIYKNYHSFTIKNRRIFYEIDEERKEIIIYHILGGFQLYEDII